MAGITGIGHVLVRVDDVEGARRDWTRLGFVLSPRGRYIGWRTAGYSVMFGAEYIDLIGVGTAAGKGGIGDFLRGPAGNIAVAWSGRDMPDETDTLALQLELSERTALLRFDLADLPVETTPALPGFLCRPVSEEVRRRAEWLDHPNGAVALKGMTVMAEDIDAVAAAYEALFGLGAITRTDDIVTLRLGGISVVFAAAHDMEALYPDLEPSTQPSPAVLTLRSADLNRTADYLTEWHLEFEQHGTAAIFVPPSMASGVALEFVVG